MKILGSVVFLTGLSAVVFACSTQEVATVGTQTEALAGDILFEETWENGTGRWDTTDDTDAITHNFANGRGVPLKVVSAANETPPAGQGKTCSSHYLQETEPYLGGRFFTKQLITLKAGTKYCMEVLNRGGRNSNGFIGYNATTSVTDRGNEHWLIGGNPTISTGFGVVTDKVAEIVKDGKWHWAAKEFTVPTAPYTVGSGATAVTKNDPVTIVIKGEQFAENPNGAAVDEVAEFDDIRLVEGPCPTVAPLPNVDEISCPNSCDIPTNTCIACTGSLGTVTPHPCQVPTRPICDLSGPTAGACRGCKLDSECGSDSFCNTQKGSCDAKLANGVSVPTVSGRNNPDPVLDGQCTETVAQRVCKALVCYADDDKCGYPDGSGPCTPQNGSTVCRSGFCGTDGKCISAGACKVDADCKGTNGWCDMSAGRCKPTVSNGGSIPTDSAHTSPKVAGECADDTAQLVCTSKVCEESDDKCGYLNGHACGSAPTCRSAYCHTDKKCGKPVGESCDGDAVCRSNVCENKKCAACTEDADCPTAMYCDLPGTAEAACAPKKPNRQACGEANECISSTCDTNDKCGKMDGRVCSRASECQSDACTDGACGTGKCTKDADCGSATSGRVCDTSVTGGKCVDGCRASGENGCPTDLACEVKSGAKFGACVDPASALKVFGGGCSTTPESRGVGLLGGLLALATVIGLRLRRKSA